MNEEEIVLTPMMKQFLDLKAKHPDAVMLFRCGDFYETYSTDAIVAAEILGITLTKRANGGISSSCARYLSSEIGSCRKTGGYLRPVGRPENDQETGEARHYRIGDSRCLYQ